MTPEEANEKLLRRRAQVAAAKAPDAVGSVAETLFRNVRVIPDAQIAKRREDERTMNIQRVSADLLARAGLPKRQFETIAKGDGRYDKWMTAFGKVKGRLGTGFTGSVLGERGTGKTQMGVELIRHWVAGANYCRFLTLEEFLAEIKATFGEGSGSERDVIHKYRRPKLLVLDEVDSTSQREWEARPLFQLINYRYQDKTDTLFLSNFLDAEFQKFVGAKIANRIKETGFTLECDWKGFR